MAVVLGWMGLFEDHVDGSGLASFDKVFDSAEHVVELTDIARAFVDTMTSDGATALKPVPLRSTLETELDPRREIHHDASFEVQDPLTTVSVTASGMPGSVYTNLLNNAVQHNP